ncbi:MAG: OmpA family protein [Arcobacter sp.]|nr:OmpA family protein [Arcobacter sp.]
MKLSNIKKVISSTLVASMLVGCASSSSNQNNNNNGAMIGTAVGAVAGIILGNNVGGGSKTRNKMIGAMAGAAIGGAIGYSMDKQAKEVADSLDTNVNNNPNAVLDPSQDLIVSSTDKFVKIIFRDKMMFETNSSIPTQSAASKISKLTSVLDKYPNTIIQVVGYTDTRGSYEYNKKLSEQRASNVGNTLFSSGVKNQIFSRGCSYDKPVAPNTNKTNMALNRRVEIYLYPNAQAVIDVCK